MENIPANKIRQVSVTQVHLGNNKGETHVTSNVKTYVDQLGILMTGVALLAFPVGANLGKNPEDMRKMIIEMLDLNLEKNKGTHAY